jgi:hypothetical protein
MPFSFTGFGSMAIIMMVLFLTIYQAVKRVSPEKDTSDL